MFSSPKPYMLKDSKLYPAVRKSCPDTLTISPPAPDTIRSCKLISEEIFTSMIQQECVCINNYMPFFFYLGSQNDYSFCPE